MALDQTSFWKKNEEEQDKEDENGEDERVKKYKSAQASALSP